VIGDAEFLVLRLGLSESNPLLSMPDDVAATMIRSSGYWEFCRL
jgi:hypothetical protein